MSGAGVDTDVLIVGLGPVGATLATLLADHGLSVLAIERDMTVYPLPRAVHFDHEIMRLFQQMGLADEILAHTRTTGAYEFRAADGALLMSFEGLDTQGPSGWSSSYMFHQPGLETALRARLAQSPTVQVELGCRFESLVQHDDHVSAVIDGPAGRRTVVARYLVGCDGAASPVRVAIGGSLDDYQFDEPWLVIDAMAGEGSGVPAVNLQICDPARPTTCVLSGPGRHRWEFMLLPGETLEQVVEDDFIRPLIAPWCAADAVTIERKAVYRFHGLVARAWRSGRVLLAGDSCHQTPPFAGQGMCSGLRDAANLAWKLAAVLQGGAGEALLDTYQSEREPHARSYIELAMGMGRLVCTQDPKAAADRDADMLARRAAGESALPPPRPPPLGPGCTLADSPGAGTLFPQPWARGEANDLRLDDALGAGAWLIAAAPAPPPSSPGLQVVGLDDPRLAPFRAPLAAWLSARAAAAVLVRPDRYVFGTGDAGALSVAYGLSLGGEGE